jgi:hypothetical protein
MGWGKIFKGDRIFYVAGIEKTIHLESYSQANCVDELMFYKKHGIHKARFKVHT